MPQTRFVLQKALEVGLKPIVVVNKCDRPEGRPDAVVNEVFDLLVELGADDLALDFPVLFASGRDGWAAFDRNDRNRGVSDLFHAIHQRVPSPKGDATKPLQFLVTNLDYNDYVGRIAIGRVYQGSVKPGLAIVATKQDGSVKRGRVSGVKRFEGLGRQPADLVEAGDLCAIEGIPDIEIGDTICLHDQPLPMERVKVDEPTLHTVFRINDGPLGGREGKFVTSRQIWDRLQKELEKNVALKVSMGDTSDEFHVSGRGLLHLGVLIENMRREGFELTVGKPQVIEKEIDGVTCEPFERLVLDTALSGMGPSLELLGQRGAEILKVDTRGERMHVEAEIPARGLIGLRTRVLNATAGEAVMYHSFHCYKPLKGAIAKRQNGVMISMESGTATAYALLGLGDRGFMFICPSEVVYEGMIVGEHNRDNDLNVNVVKAKQLTNFREAAKEATVVLKAPRLMSLEAALEYIEEDELVEITPTQVRVRKKILDEAERRRHARNERSRAESVGT